MALLSRQIAEREHRPNRWPIAAAVATAAVLTACYFGYQWMTRAAAERRAGPVRTFKVAATRPFLVEADAVAKAREAMALEGFQASRWQPRPVLERSKSPDGEPDKFLVRKADNPNRGTIFFDDVEVDPSGGATRPASSQRIVQVERVGDEIQCKVIRAK